MSCSSRRASSIWLCELVLGDGALLLDGERAPRERRLVGVLLDALARRHLRAPSPSRAVGFTDAHARGHDLEAERRERRRRRRGRAGSRRGRPRCPRSRSARSGARATKLPRELLRELLDQRRASLSSGSVRQRPVRVSIEKSTRSASSSGSRTRNVTTPLTCTSWKSALRAVRRGTAARDRRAAPRRSRSRAARTRTRAPRPLCLARPFLKKRDPARRLGAQVPQRTNTNESRPWCAPFTSFDGRASDA